MPDYPTTCPACGAALVPHVGESQDAPWLCNGCARGWWPVELGAETRLAWDSRLGSFRRPHPVHGAVVEAVAAAHARGVNVDDVMVKLPDVAAKLAAFKGRRGKP